MNQGRLHSNQAQHDGPPLYQKRGRMEGARKAEGHRLWQAKATRRSYHQKAILQHNHRAKHSQGRMKWEKLNIQVSLHQQNGSTRQRRAPEPHNVDCTQGKRPGPQSKAQSC